MNKVRPTLHFSIIQALYWASYNAIYGYASYFLISNGFKNSEAGYVIALGGLLSVAVQPIIGAIADKSKKMIINRLIIIFSLIVVICSGIILGLNNQFWIVALFYGLTIMCLQELTPLTNAIGIFFKNKGVNINFGCSRGIGSLAYGIMAAVLGVLTEKLGQNIIIYIVLVLYLLLALSTLLFHFKGVSEDNVEYDNIKKSNVFEFIKKHKKFFILLIGNTLIFISYNILNNFLFQIVSYHGQSSKEMGFALTLGACLELPALFLLDYLNKNVKSGLLFKISIVFIFFKCLIFYLATNINMIYVAMSMQVLGYGLYSGISVYYVNHVIEVENQVTGQSLLTSTIALGGVIGSILGGYLLDLTSIPVMLLVELVIAFVGLIISLLSIDKGNLVKK